MEEATKSHDLFLVDLDDLLNRGVHLGDEEVVEALLEVEAVPHEGDPVFALHQLAAKLLNFISLN